MKTSLNKGFTLIFWLIVFLFPMVEKGIQAVGHEEDVHCEAIDTTHLHTKHHTCSICDYSNDEFASTQFFETTLEEKSVQGPLFTFTNRLFAVSVDLYSLKSPPAGV